MANIPKMTNSELERVLSEAKNELARRDNIVKALAEIAKILEKYNLQAADIDWRRLNRLDKAGKKKKPSRKSSAAVKVKAKEKLKRDRRSSVAPKYSNANGRENGQVVGDLQVGSLIFAKVKILTLKILN